MVLPSIYRKLFKKTLIIEISYTCSKISWQIWGGLVRGWRVSCRWSRKNSDDDKKNTGCPGKGCCQEEEISYQNQSNKAIPAWLTSGYAPTQLVLSFLVVIFMASKVTQAINLHTTQQVQSLLNSASPVAKQDTGDVTVHASQNKEITNNFEGKY